MNRSIGSLLCFILMFSTSLNAIAQDTASSRESSSEEAKSIPDDTEQDAVVVAGKPYVAKVQIDTPMPVTYGNDVVISVWLSPSAAFDLKEVRLHPKGSLADLYESSEPKVGPGVPCTSSIQYAKPSIPIVATCRLTSKATGFGRIFNWNAVLIASARQQFEVEVVTREGPTDLLNYYEFGAINFVSPMLSVVLGGILGAGLWTMFLPISTPLPSVTSTPLSNWRALRERAWDALPQVLLRWISFIAGFLRSTFLGGTTALILIILAKTTEGLDTPIALQVQDLWGGLLVGIFSTPLAKWVRGRVEKAMQEP